MKKWQDLPDEMRTEAVLPYYNILKSKKISLFLKRAFDILAALVLLIVLSPLFIIISVAIVIDSKGGVFFCQERVTKYGKKFKILKFRTMVKNAENIGTLVTLKNDVRITKVGKIIRKVRLDELPQLINIILGQMSFVGTRPEVTKFVSCYTPPMYATLLMPAGVTSLASILYKNEEKLMQQADDADSVYITKVLPQKMEYNLKSIENFSLINEFLLMFKTLAAVIKK